MCLDQRQRHQSSCEIFSSLFSHAAIYLSVLTVLFWCWLYNVRSWDGFGMISRGMRNSRNATIHPGCPRFHVSPLLQAARRSVQCWRWRKTFCSRHLAVVTHYHPPAPSTTLLPFPTPPPPLARSLPFSLSLCYIQALLPGQLIGWNTQTVIAGEHGLLI